MNLQELWPFKLFRKKAPAPPALPALALTVMQINQKLNDWYNAERGVVEVGGNNQGPRVSYYQLTVDNIADGEPWCMSFLQTGLWEMALWLSTFHDLKHLSPRMIYKLIKIHKSESVMEVWNKTPEKYKIPIPGDRKFNLGLIEFCWFIQQSIAEPRFGHAGKAIKLESIPKLSFLTVEGNTNVEGSREGDGVYNRIRFMQNGEKMNFRGFVNVSQAIKDMITENSTVRR